jgi:hypothetical protein
MVSWVLAFLSAVIVERRRDVEVSEVGVTMKCSGTSKRRPTCYILTLPFLHHCLVGNAMFNPADSTIEPLYETEKALSGFSRAWGSPCEGVANPLLGIGFYCDWLSSWKERLSEAPSLGQSRFGRRNYRCDARVPPRVRMRMWLVHCADEFLISRLGLSARLYSRYLRVETCVHSRRVVDCRCCQHVRRFT